MLKMLKVSGESLAPEYREGDFVLIAKIPFLLNHLKAGDVVAFHHPVYGIMIKKIASITADGDEFFVVGTHENSVDSRQFGAIPQVDIFGKVIWHIRKPVEAQ